MNRQDAEKIITEYLKPIFGFALKRCQNAHDAEDLSQDIVLKAFRAFLNNGKLKPPTEEQKKSLTTLIVQN